MEDGILKSLFAVLCLCSASRSTELTLSDMNRDYDEDDYYTRSRRGDMRRKRFLPISEQATDSKVKPISPRPTCLVLVLMLVGSQLENEQREHSA